MSAPPAVRPSWTRRRWVVLGVLAAVVVGVTVGLVLFFGGDEPEQVDAERALQQDQDPMPWAEEEAAEEQAAPEANEEVDEEAEEAEEEAEEDEGPIDPEDLDGVWIVDHSRDFDREEGRGTFAGYRIQEELRGVGNNVAVGRTPEVDGQVTFVGGTLAAARFEVDLTSLVSDDNRRDARVRSQLGPDATAEFEMSGLIQIPEVPPVGEVIELMVPGVLTIDGTSNEVEIELQAVVTETGLLVAGNTVIVLEDYDVEVPSASMVLSVSDEATVEWQLFLVRE
jgi:polyisoprenoid-binding protein YceI